MKIRSGFVSNSSSSSFIIGFDEPIRDRYNMRWSYMGDRNNPSPILIYEDYTDDDLPNTYTYDIDSIEDFLYKLINFKNGVLLEQYLLDTLWLDMRDRNLSPWNVKSLSMNEAINFLKHNKHYGNLEKVLEKLDRSKTYYVFDFGNDAYYQGIPELTQSERLLTSALHEQYTDLYPYVIIPVHYIGA